MKKLFIVRPEPLRRLAGLLLAAGLLAAAPRADALDFSHRPELVGKVPLAGEGYVVIRDLGSAAISPSLTLPVQLAYASASETPGLPGHGWRIPQLESSLRPDRDGALWTTPWGERVRFAPPKGGGRTLESRAADWRAEASTADPASARRFTVTGRYALRGWSFLYADSLLREIRTPDGAAASVAYDAAGRPVSLSAGGVAFVEVAYNADGTAASLTLNGIRHDFAHAARTVPVLPKTADGRPSERRVALLASVSSPGSDPVLLGYDGCGYLTSVRQGASAETLAVENETPAERKASLLGKDAEGGAKSSGKAAGRLLADGSYRYAYPGPNAVTLTDAAGRTSETSLDVLRGVLRRRGFDGRRRTTYYHMRWDSAYLGRVRLVEDGRGRDFVRLRFDRATGLPTRVTDALGNVRRLEYDADGNCTKILRRSGWLSGWEPVRAFAHDAAGRVTAVSELDSEGNAARTLSVAYDRRGRPVRVSDGRRKAEVSYAPNGFPASVSDDLGTRLRLSYDRYNRPVSATDADGVETRLSYDAAGRLARAERRDGRSVISSVSVAYDGCGRPVSATDGEGRTAACDRDALGRIVRERYADGAEASYLHDAIGRLAKVVDENGHEIEFKWDGFGLASRRTAAGQLTEFARDANGLVASVSASKDGKTDRTIRRAYDKYDRVVRIEYAKGEAETFAYDRWGRLAERTLGKARETYAYDHFGRLAERRCGDLAYRYSYDAWGCRTSLAVTDGSGGTVVSERRTYDRYGRLAKISSFGRSVTFAYDRRGRLSRQTVDGIPVDYDWTRGGRLAAKWFGGRREPVASVAYEYSRDGRVAARTANGVRQEYAYDARGRLLSVREGGEEVERYAYDRAGNVLWKTVRGRTTEYAYDGANQLVSSVCGGVRTEYAYDAAGRLVREGNRTYRYGYLDKLLAVTEGDRTFTYAYRPDGQFARADWGDGTAEDFVWDGLALVRRGGESLLNEPHAGGGSPVLSSSGTAYFSDILGTTLGEKGRGRGYAAARQTAFGEGDAAYFTGKPAVAGLGRAFLYRNYRPDLAKWATADPLGYPDGWNSLAYCGNEVTGFIDFLGARREQVVRFDTPQDFRSDFVVIPWYNSEWDAFGLARKEALKAGESVEKWVNDKLKEYRKNKIKGAKADAFMTAAVGYFSGLQGGPYNEVPPGDGEDPWKTILESMEADGWILESGPEHTGISLNRNDDIVNAGLGALIIEGCTHHWKAKFVKE